MMLYNEYERKIDILQNEIRELKRKNDFKGADLKGLELAYLKVNYYEGCYNAETIRRTKQEYYDSYSSALRSLATTRDYLFEKYNYEEA